MSRTDDDLRRAWSFVLRADMFGSRVEAFRFGRAVHLHELPLRMDSNYLLLEDLPRGVDAAALAAEADAVQGAAGLAHRCLVAHDAAQVEHLAPGFRALGWTAFRGVLMAQRRASLRAADTSRAVRVDPGRLTEARTAHILGYPWSTPEIARQLLAARAYAPVRAEHYAVFDGGRPVAWAELYLEGDTAQVEAVATLEPWRNRGYASALVTRCADEARRAGADLVVLCADAEDWPRRLYDRLGFDTLGTYLKFLRPPPPAGDSSAGASGPTSV